MNTIGRYITLTTFGESHGEAIGGVLDGFPSNVRIDLDEVQREMARRRPGQSAITTGRQESDRVRVLSGMLDGVTTGAPIGFIIENTNQRSGDYDELAHVFRPSHADYTYEAKYGVRDYRGGGRASARETAVRVAAGAFCKQWLALKGIRVSAWAHQVGDIVMSEAKVDPESNVVRCPDPEAAARMIDLITQVKAEGDTIGGVVACRISGVPAGVGEPHFDRLNGRLGAAMLSIPAVKGVEFGMGFEGCARRGSEMIDEFIVDKQTGRVVTRTNHSGGIQGGISNGMDIDFKVGFKPVATLLREVATVNDSGQEVTLKARGRHDPCVVPRAVPVVEAMAALTVADLICGVR